MPLGRREAAVAALLIAVFTLEVHTSVRQKSAILHEPLYAWAGYRYLTAADYGANLDSPPLLKQLAALPLLPLHLQAAPAAPPPADSADRFLFDNTAPADTILARARAPFLVLGVGLGVLLFAWTRALYGPRGALLALSLYAFNPALLGQAGFANHDFGLACLSVAALYALWKLCERPSVGREIAAGVALGLALVSKFTALLLVPTGIGLALADVWVRGPATGRLRALGRRLAVLAGVMAIAAFVVWADYGFRTGDLHLAIFRLVMTRIAPGSLVTRALAHAPDRLAVPAPEFIEGAAAQMVHGKIGHVNYLFGRVSYGGWWYYYLVTFLYRVPLALFVLLLLRVATWRPGGRTRTWGEVWVLTYAVATTVLFSLSRTQLGERYVLVVYPLLFVFLGGLAEARAGRRWIVPAVGLCLGWYALVSLRAYPDYLTYFNPLAGGPDHGYRKIIEGVDLGQDARGLQRFVAAHDIEAIRVSCFGCPPPRRLGPAFAPLGCKPARGWLAVSVRQLVMPEPFLPHGCFDWLARHEPVARIGHSLYVYDIRDGPT